MTEEKEKIWTEKWEENESLAIFSRLFS